MERIAWSRTRAKCKADNANGAGISADPTVTDAWPSSFNARFKGRGLGIRCFPFQPSGDSRKVLSPALAPASGSTRRSARFCCAAIGGSFACMTQPRLDGRFRSHAFRWWREVRTVTSLLRPEDLDTTPLSPLCRVGLARQRETFTLPSSTRLAPGKNLRHEGLEKRVDRTRGVFPATEIPLFFRSLDRPNRSGSAPFRWLEAAPRQPVFQVREGRLIHFPRNLLWRSMDNSTARRNFVTTMSGVAQSWNCAPDYFADSYRSRFASRRRRRAFSLMKPSASFWS